MSNLDEKYENDRLTNLSAARAKDSLKSDMNGFGHNIQDLAADKSHEASAYVQKQMKLLQANGNEALKSVEGYVASNPTQSVAIAFGAGVVFSYLFGRKA